MTYTHRTSLLEVFADKGEDWWRSERHREVLRTTTLQEWGTYLAEGSPKSVAREALPSKRRKTFELVDRVSRLIDGPAKRAVQNHGPAEKPDWINRHNLTEDSTMSGAGDEVTSEVLEEAYYDLWGETPPPRRSGDELEESEGSGSDEAESALEEAYRGLWS